MYEPKYSNTNYQYESSLSDSNSSDVECYGNGDSMNDSSAREKRSGNLLYCKCGKCKVMETEVESICCKEMAEIDEGRLGGKDCINEVNQFECVCLNPAVLKTALISYINESKSSKIKGTFDNKNMRYGGYKQYTYWIHNKLGKGVCRVIPIVCRLGNTGQISIYPRTLYHLKTCNVCIQYIFLSKNQFAPFFFFKGSYFCEIVLRFIALLLINKTIKF